MDILFRHFWLFFIGVMILNVVAWRRRLRELESHGHASRAETDRFIRGALIAFVAMGVLGELTVLVSGWPSSLCIWTADPRSPGAMLAWGTSIAIAVLLLWWVWIGHGALTLSRLGPALFTRTPIGDRPYRPYAPAIVKAVVTLWLAASTIGLVVVTRGGAQPIPGCPLGPGATATVSRR